MTPLAFLKAEANNPVNKRKLLYYVPTPNNRTTSTMSPHPDNQIITYYYREKTSPCFLWTLALAPCLMPAVWKYHVTVTATELSFGFSSGCMQNQIDRMDILEAEEIEHINGFLDWGGYGIRKQLPSWDTGYIARNGPGVRIKIKKSNGKEACYTFSCHEPAQVVNLLCS